MSCNRKFQIFILQIRTIFTNIGVKMTGEEMETAFKMASDCHPKGHVSVEGFRNVLDEIQVQRIKAGEHPMSLGEVQ